MSEFPPTPQQPAPEWSAQQYPAGWYPDPYQTGSTRWFDGYQWGPPGEPTATLQRAEWFPNMPALKRQAIPLAIALVGLTIGLNQLGTWYADRNDASPIQAVIALAVLALTGFGYPLVALASSYAWGTGSPKRDLGMSAKLIDLALGPAGAVALFGATILTSLLVQAIGLPQSSNLDGLTGDERSTAVLIVTLVLAGLIAPITEELLFRGMLMRGLLSMSRPKVAVLIQGLIFGTAHFQYQFGWGNVGLLIVLSVLGVLLGLIVRATGRLWPAMIAHALFNCTQVLLAWYLK